jgi:acetyl esterase/lipase/NRPS condensation-like uncharacterized protein
MMNHTTSFLKSQFSLIKPFVENTSLNTARKWQDKIGKLVAHTFREDVKYEDFEHAGMKCSLVTPKDEISEGIILYLHGGGYTSGNIDYARGIGSIFASMCGIKVMSVAYRLAPEHIFPAALDDAFEAYEHLLMCGYSNDKIILCGDSAGGGLCYSLCMKLKEKGRAIPAGIIALSPWSDLNSTGESYKTNVKCDPSMTVERLKYFADCYVYGSEVKDGNVYPVSNSDADEDFKIKSNPFVSPLYGELSDMPPSLIFAGGDEIMLDDSVKLHEKLRESGCDSELHVTPGMWHGYVIYCLKEYRSDFDRIRKFIRAVVPHQKKLRWMTLDNAAKIFPAARRRNWSNVFRLSANLNEEIDIDTLKTALDVTVRRFPSIAVRVRPGFFWYYLEEIPKAPDIIEEKPFPLSKMAFDDIRKCAFRVIAYKNRIAVEFFHALTDGNGGLIFLKTLVSEYLYQKYGVKVPCGDGILDRLEEPSTDELEDSFLKYAGPVSASRKDTNAYKITGTTTQDGYKTNTTFILDANEVSAEAKKLGVTVTAYMVSALMSAICRIQTAKVKNKKRYKPVKVLIPVNLRKMFPSKTLRNFVLYAIPALDMKLGEYSFDEICKLVHHQMQLAITPKNMAAMMAANVNSEKPLLLRMAPLFLKNFVMKMVFNAVGERKASFSFSNLGIVKTPDEFNEYVERLDFVLGVQSYAPYNTSAITYKGKLNLNIIRNIKEPVLEREIYEVFKELGLKPVVQSNTRIEEK